MTTVAPEALGGRMLILSRAPQTDNELWHLIKYMWGIELPRIAVCPDHVSPFDAVAHAYFGKEPGFAVWYASRGSGKSLALAVLGLTKGFVDDVDVTILGGSMTQSLNVREHMRKLMAHPNAPMHVVAKDTATLIQLHSGRNIKPLPASQTTVRGPHPPLQLLDEVDEMDEDIYNASLGQAMEQINTHGTVINEYIVASSTWQNPIGCTERNTLVTLRRGTVPIYQARVGDEVPTRSGWRKITHVHETGMQECVKIDFASGRSLTCTPWHPIWVRDLGFVKASLLAPFRHVGVHVRPVLGAISGGSGTFTDQTAQPIATLDQTTKFREVVPIATCIRLGTDVPGPGVVLASRHRLQVPDVDAGSTAADLVLVVECKPFWDGPAQLGPDPTMGEPDALGRSQRPIGLDPVTVGHDAQWPDDAIVGVEHEDMIFEDDLVVSVRHLGMVLPTCDLTVDGSPEYVANGILVHNTFTNIIEKARAEGQPVFTWCWRELIKSEENPSGWMTERFIQQKRRTVSAEMWRCLPQGELVQTSRGEVPIEHIAPGDQVWTRQGWRPVTALVRQSDRPVFTVATTDGRSYSATGNHKVAVPGGWKTTDSLQAGDSLVSSDPPHVLAVAGAAVPTALGVGPGLSGSGVAVDACVAGVVEVALGGVPGPSDSLQMIGVDAPGSMTRVMDRHTFRYGAVPGDVGHPVRVATADRKFADAVPVLGARPGPDGAAVVVEPRSSLQVGREVGDARQAAQSVGARQTADDAGARHSGTAVATGVCHVESVSVSRTAVPTWDISVLGTHEFTVRGIVVHNTEYELNEPSGSSRAFDLEAIEQYFEEYPEALTHEHAKASTDDWWVWEDWVTTGDYAAGADWAKEKDKTVIVVVRYDVRPRRIVYLRRMNRLKYPIMLKAFDDARKKYGDCQGRHDGTGLGNVVHDFLQHDGSEAGKEIMVGRQRSQLFSNYITDFENGGYRLPRKLAGVTINDFYKSHRGATVADVFAPHKWNNHTPDDLVAMALAHKVAGRVTTGVTAIGVAREDTPSRLEKAFAHKPLATHVVVGDVVVEDDRYASDGTFWLPSD